MLYYIFFYLLLIFTVHQVFVYIEDNYDITLQSLCSPASHNQIMAQPLQTQHSLQFYEPHQSQQPQQPPQQQQQPYISEIEARKMELKKYMKTVL